MIIPSLGYHYYNTIYYSSEKNIFLYKIVDIG